MQQLTRHKATRTSGATPFGLDLSMAVFDRVTRLASNLFKSAGASIILVRGDEVWRSDHAGDFPTDDPVTKAVMASSELFWVEDGRLDPRVSDNPLVVGPPFLRFTVSVPIILRDGSTPGVLSVSGLEPQPFDRNKAARLTDLADFVADEWTRAQAIHERNIALENRERSEDRLSLALTLSGIHVWELDFKRRELITAGAGDTFFYRPPTYQDLYKDIFATIDPRDRLTVVAAWKEHIENGAPYRPEYRIDRPDGIEVWVQGATKLFTDEQGHPTRLVGAIQNITARKLAEHELRKTHEAAEAANRSKSEFLATMSHELRTPLNAILGFSEMMESQIVGPLGSTKYVEYAADIHKSGQHLLDLINDILDLAKIDSGKRELQESEIDLYEIVRDCVSILMVNAESAGVLLINAVGKHTPSLRADRRTIKQVLLNFLSNAIKFTPRGGHVSISVQLIEYQWCELSVTDNGIGMNQADIEVAFAPFGQVDSNLARQHIGTGLGLPVSRSLMKLHGGDITIASAPNAGTTITARFPYARVVENRASRSAKKGD